MLSFPFQLDPICLVPCITMERNLDVQPTAYSMSHTLRISSFLMISIQIQLASSDGLLYLILEYILTNLKFLTEEALFKTFDIELVLRYNYIIYWIMFFSPICIKFTGRIKFCWGPKVYTSWICIGYSMQGLIIYITQLFFITSLFFIISFFSWLSCINQLYWDYCFFIYCNDALIEPLLTRKCIFIRIFVKVYLHWWKCNIGKFMNRLIW